MKEFCFSFLLFVSVFCRPACAGTTGFVSTRGSEIVDPEGKPLLLRGVNLGNWLVPEGYMFKFKHASSPRKIHEVISELVGPAEAQAFWRDFRDSYITRDDIRLIKQLGLNSIRVPFNHKLFSPEETPGVWSGPGFEMLDRVVGWCKEVGLWIVLDMHCAPGGQTGDNIDDSWGAPFLFQSTESRALAAETWRRIAERYGQETTVIGYDLLNEPIAPFTDTTQLNSLLEPTYKEIVHEIRKVDTNHVVFLGGAQWDTNFGVFGPPFDRKVVYTFHKYWCDTTQAMIQEYVDFRSRYNVPIWMGESGENKDEWIRGWRSLLERNSIGWCFWPYKKLDATTCVMTFDRPEVYEEIVRFANAPRGSYEEIRKARPPVEEVRKALQGLLENCKFPKCRMNEGYVKALDAGR
jgi:aryl-phospho-beta-D-glucosidase BglC (GH1 family)